MKNTLELPATIEQAIGEAEDELELLTVDDLKRIFHIEEGAARKLYRKYGLRSVKLPGREVRFTRTAVRDFIRQCELGLVVVS